MRQFHSNEANPPDSRHTVSYTEYHPLHVSLLVPHVRLHALYPFQKTPNGCGASQFFSALSTLFRRQGDNPLTVNPLYDPSLETVDLTSSRRLGDPLFF